MCFERDVLHGSGSLGRKDAAFGLCWLEHRKLKIEMENERPTKVGRNETVFRVEPRRWEYFKADTFSIEEFNTLGAQGWELVALDRDFAWFKRQKP